jgi:hypothetical protein
MKTTNEFHAKDAKRQRRKEIKAHVLSSVESFVSVTFKHESKTRNHHRSACKSAEEP